MDPDTDMYTDWDTDTDTDTTDITTKDFFGVQLQFVHLL
jgi:hypothetical protein